MGNNSPYSPAFEELLRSIKYRRERPHMRVYRFFLRIWSFIRWDIPNGIKGLIYWTPYAWQWRPWDWADGLRALEHHLVRLERSIRYGYHEDGELMADNVAIAIRLIRWNLEDRHSFALVKDQIDSKEYERLSEEDWEHMWHALEPMRAWWD